LAFTNDYLLYYLLQHNALAICFAFNFNNVTRSNHRSRTMENVSFHLFRPKTHQSKKTKRPSQTDKRDNKEIENQTPYAFANIKTIVVEYFAIRFLIMNFES
jgi:hypothetical protein